jgi:hypothetical protein
MFRKKTQEELAAIEHEREVKARQREAERLTIEKREQDAAFAQTPAGKAREARKQGSYVFQISLPVSESKGQVYELLGPVRKTTMRRSKYGSVFDAIETEGWRLEHAGYTFVVTGTESRAMTLARGEREAVSGTVLGIYLFRRVDDEI